MQTLTYLGTFKIDLLMDELLGAGITPIRLESAPDNGAVWIVVADQLDPQAVAAVVSAHDPAQLTAHEVEKQQRANDSITLADRISSARTWIIAAQNNADTALAAGADGYTTAEIKTVLDGLLNQQKTSLEILDKVLAYIRHEVGAA